MKRHFVLTDEAKVLRDSTLYFLRVHRKCICGIVIDSRYLLRHPLLKPRNPKKIMYCLIAHQSVREHRPATEFCKRHNGLHNRSRFYASLAWVNGVTWKVFLPLKMPYGSGIDLGILRSAGEEIPLQSAGKTTTGLWVSRQDSSRSGTVGVMYYDNSLSASLITPYAIFEQLLYSRQFYFIYTEYYALAQCTNITPETHKVGCCWWTLLIN